MSEEYCRIIFDNPQNTYFAGQTVSGKVEIALQEPKQIKGIRIEIKGAARVRWTESKQIHAANEDYFHSVHYLVRDANHDTFTLPAGNHVYMFSCPLATNLPSSLEGEFGHIRYEADMVVERPWIWNQRTKAVFTVISHYNLNMFPHLLSPTMVTAGKYFSCCCCKSGPLTVILRISKSGYVCGEKVHAIMEIDNTSNVNIDKINLNVQQIIIFRSTYPSAKTKKEKIVFLGLNIGSIQQRRSKTMSHMISIPPLPPSSFYECAIIDTEYQVSLECVAPGCQTNLEAFIPITIGAIPFTTETTVGDSSPPSYGEAVESYANNETIGWEGNVIPSAPVPSFSESAFSRTKSIEATDDGEHKTYNNYSPTYPIYKFEYPTQQ